MEYRMNIDFFAIDQAYRQVGTATRPLARLTAHLPLSLVVAGTGLPPPRFAAATLPDAPSGTSNCGFQVK
jgi:hypothetical protein